MEHSHLITYLLFAPFIGGILLLFIGNKKENLIRYFGLAVSIITFIISLIIYFNFDLNNPAFQFIHKINSAESFTNNLPIRFYLDSTCQCLCRNHKR